MAVIQLLYFYCMSVRVWKKKNIYTYIYILICFIYELCKLFSANVTELLFISSSGYHFIIHSVSLFCCLARLLFPPTYTYVLMQFVHQTSKKTHTQTTIQWSKSMTETTLFSPLHRYRVWSCSVYIKWYEIKWRPCCFSEAETHAFVDLLRLFDWAVFLFFFLCSFTGILK